MKAFILLCVLAGLVACKGAPPLSEVAKQKTATVYACGGWNQPQIDQIKASVDDLNLNARYENTQQFFVYGGEKPGLYGNGENNGILCVYWIYENYPTQAGRDMWDGARPENEHDWLAGEWNGDNVFIYGNGACPPNTSCTWMMGNVVTHELGHALGAGHLSGERAVMTTPASSWRLTIVDVEEICSNASCDPNYTAPAARLADETSYDRLAPAKFDCLNG